MTSFNNYRDNSMQSAPGMQIPCPYSGHMQMQPAQTAPLMPVSPAIGTTLPTGMPAGAVMGPMPATALIPTAPTADIAPQTVESIQFTPGYLRTQIGRKIKVEFLIGTNMLIDREGTLISVGASYIIIRETETDDLLLCDLYSIKFIRFYY